MKDTYKTKEQLINELEKAQQRIAELEASETMHKETEEKLHESEEKYRMQFEEAMDAIFLADAETGILIDCNRAASKLVGREKSELIGNHQRILHPLQEIEGEMSRTFKQHLKEREGQTLETQVITENGETRDVAIKANLFEFKGKKLLQGIFRDITDRKMAEEALRQSEKKYRELFEESKDVVYISTPGGRFIDINQAGVELFGYTSKEELLQIDIPHDLYVNPEDRIKLQHLLVRHGYVKDFEVVFKRKDGAPVTVLLATTILRDKDGRISAYRGIIKDITVRKRLEQQLLQAQKMEAIGQLAGGIAHDFNNILTAIIGFGNLLQIEINKDDPMSIHVTQILKSAQRAANLTQALLAFSRRQIISPKPININEIIKGVEKLLSRLIGEDIELSTIISDKDLIVMADVGQIEQVLMNLVTNARDAMPEGGSLVISTDHVELPDKVAKTYGFDRPGSYSIISVEDTGYGMDEVVKERIFEPFFTTKDVGKGTGLGLAIVYGIVKQHDGYINVYSEPGKGTTFKVYLPLIKLKIKDTKTIDIPVIKRGTETVLIAEDDEQVRELIKEVLKGFGYTVLEAADGEEALRVFNENKDKIQLLIFDVIMPKKNGKEVFNEIKKENPDIKVIFTSGYNSDIIHKKGILNEGLDVILKPILPDKLLKTVRKLLDERKIT